VVVRRDEDRLIDSGSQAALALPRQRSDMDNWGRVNGSQSLENGKTEATVRDENGNPIKLQLSNPLRVPQVALKGRRTEVMDAISADLESPGEDGMVAKIYWAEERRDSEASILQVAKEIAHSNEKVKGHVPELLLSYRFQLSTSKIRTRLRIKREDAERGSRTLYLLVFRRLRPIWTLLPDSKELLDVWIQCFLCHYGLWKGGVQHRDISASNLMYYRQLDGKVIGVVNDFDLATLAGSERKFGNERTGTVPFMAMELLQKDGQDGCVVHRYRHEVESFIWVFLWVSCQCIASDGTLRKGFLDELGKVDAEKCAQKKAQFISSRHVALPEDVDDDLTLHAWDCIAFLQLQMFNRAKLTVQLQKKRTQLGRMEDSEPTASQLKEEVAELEGKLNSEDVDRLFQDFSTAIDLERRSGPGKVYI